jgi:type II secretory pathway pseudopilin PulG
MTLLEAIIAFVLLSVVGVVCLDQTRGATQLQVRSAEWTDAVARAESALAAATASALPEIARTNGEGDDARDGVANVRNDRPPNVSRTPWRSGLDRIVVRVPLTSGGTFVLERLVPVAPVVSR